MTDSNKRRRIEYFFLNGELHRKLHINRGADVIHAWNYPQARRVAYVYSETRRNLQRGFKTKEVAKMLNRAPLTIKRAIHDRNIRPPTLTYHLDTRKPFQYIWGESDIIELHRYMRTVHRGRPRKDGGIQPQAMPSERELRAMIRNEVVYYVLSDGEFRPTWDSTL